MRKLRRKIRSIKNDQSGQLASDYAIMFSLGTLGSLVVLAGVGVMPPDFVEFAIQSLGGALGLFSS